MVEIRRSNERGKANFGWLDSRHTFSFGNYYDPKHMGFRALRVINEDKVVPGAGFGAHPHKDMEIVTYVLDGAIAHKDSTGGQSVLRRGEVQRMTAGTGVVHSEFNDSSEEPLHFLQIWIQPDRGGLEPGYEQKGFDDQEKRGALRVLVSPDGENGSLRIHQDARLFGTLLAEGDELEHELSTDRHYWVHVATGEVEANGEALKAGDAIALSNESRLTLRGVADADVLVFDLA
ncbi:MAG: pirin family protein [Myxococcota bacterium]